MIDPYPLDALSPAVLRGIAEFNNHRYYQCHETLEIVWRKERGPYRALLHGIIQIAVGMVHVERGNFKGATALLNRAIGKLRGLPPAYHGIHVAALLDAAQQSYVTVIALGPGGIGRFPWNQAPQVLLVDGAAQQVLESGGDA